MTLRINERLVRLETIEKQKPLNITTKKITRTRNKYFKVT